MKTLKNYAVLCIISIFFIGCGGSGGGGDNSSKKEVSIFTTAPVAKASVKDASNQIGSYNSDSNTYTFSNNIVYPVTVTFSENSFVDVDYDGKATATDIKPKFETLKSFCNNVNLLTTLYYTSTYEEVIEETDNEATEDETTEDTVNQISTDEYIRQISDEYNIDVCDNEDSAKVLFSLANYIFDNEAYSDDDSIDIINSTDILLSDDAFTDNVTAMDTFFNDTLSTITDENDKIQYYSAYYSLVNIDKGIFSRMDTIHVPSIPSLLKSSTIIANGNTDIDVFDIKIANETIFTAAGHETLASASIDPTDDFTIATIHNENSTSEDFGNNLYIQEYDNTTCLYLANSKVGVSAFTLNPTVFSQDILSYAITDDDGNITTETDENGDEVSVTENLTDIGGVSNVNGYVSLNNSKRLLGVSTQDKGFYLINIKDNMNGCVLSEDIKDEDILIQEGSDYSVSSAIKGDGSYLYTANKTQISGYSIQNLNKEDILESKQDFNLSDAEYYNLLLVNSGNDLFATTSQGVELYDVDSNNEINLVSSYLSEGTESGYFPQLDTYYKGNLDNFLIFTDGFYGVKILKVSSDLQPKLCGVTYFSLPDNDEELAKVTSIKYHDENLYVGVSENGLQKINFDSMLFEHCK